MPGRDYVFNTYSIHITAISPVHTSCNSYCQCVMRFWGGSPLALFKQSVLQSAWCTVPSYIHILWSIYRHCMLVGAVVAYIVTVLGATYGTDMQIFPCIWNDKFPDHSVELSFEINYFCNNFKWLIILRKCQIFAFSSISNESPGLQNVRTNLKKSHCQAKVMSSNVLVCQDKLFS